MRMGRTVRGAFHRSRTFAPQRPLGRPARVFAAAAVWPPWRRLSTPFHPRGPFRIRVGQAPVHVPRCQRESRFYEPRSRLPTSATETTRGHTLRAFDPRTRVGLSPRYSPAPTDAGCVGLRYVAAPQACEPRLANDGSHRRIPLAWTRQITGRGTREKANRALLDDIARALLVASRAPGSPARADVRLGTPRACAHQPRSTSDTAPRREIPSEGSRCLLSATKPLRERGIAPPCAPGPRPRHAASVEALLEGSRAFLCRLCGACL
jgi:hypothetical protein